MREIHQYTASDSRDLVHEGIFEVVDRMEVGDYFLCHHKCRFCKVNILQRVDEVLVAYYFNGQPIYDYLVRGAGSYKAHLKLISKYDKIVRVCDLKTLEQMGNI